MANELATRWTAARIGSTNGGEEKNRESCRREATTGSCAPARDSWGKAEIKETQSEGRRTEQVLSELSVLINNNGISLK